MHEPSSEAVESEEARICNCFDLVIRWPFLRTEGDDGGGGLVILRAFLRLWPRRRLRFAFYTRSERARRPSVAVRERRPPRPSRSGAACAVHM